MTAPTMAVMSDLRRSDLLRHTALASVIANVGIVITGGAVRLTDSGLGCPTWPRCTDASYTPSPELGIHEIIEFGNRMFTFVLGAIAIAGVVLAYRARPRRRRVVWLSILAFLVIPAQGVVGGVTVLTDLNPWVVGCHFLVSMGAIAAAYAFWVATRESDESVRLTVPPPLRWLTWVVVAASGAVLIIGTFVTGSGPHAGDAEAKRNGLDPEAVAQFHADVVFLVVGLVVAAWFAFRAVGAHMPANRTAWLFGIVMAQGLVGFVQYLTQLPEILVGVHMAGACLVWIGTLAVLYATRTRAPAPVAFRVETATAGVAAP